MNQEKDTGLTPPQAPQFNPMAEEYDMPVVEKKRPAPTAEESELKAIEESYRSPLEELQKARKRYAPESEEDRLRREKGEKSRRVINTLSDGLSSMANLIFTTKGAPDMSGNSATLSAVEADRMERLRKERRDNADKFLDFSLRIGQLERERDRQLALAGDRHAAQRRAEAKEKRDADEFEFRKGLRPYLNAASQAKARKALADADRAETIRDNADELEKSKIRRNDRSNPLEYSAKDKSGDVRYFSDPNAAIMFAQSQGTLASVRRNKKTTSTKTDDAGFSTTTSTDREEEYFYPDMGYTKEELENLAEGFEGV